MVGDLEEKSFLTLYIRMIVAQDIFFSGDWVIKNDYVIYYFSKDKSFKLAL